jgi:hypothetical protein
LRPAAHVVGSPVVWLDGGPKIQGWIEHVVGTFEEQARNYGLPFIRDDIERSNRSPEWDQRIAQDPNVRAYFRRAYAATCARHMFGVSRHMDLTPNVQATGQPERVITHLRARQRHAVKHP